MSSKGPAKGAQTINRLLEERRKYEAWLNRLRGASDATAEGVRSRVESDYAARLKAVNEELKVHAEAAKQLIAQRAETIAELRAKESQAAERLSEGELRHTVGEYDEEAWTQFRKDSLAELMSVREELQELESDLSQLQEVSELVTAPLPSERPQRSAGPPPRPATKPESKPESKAEPPRERKVDELAFIKSVTEDDKKGPSAKRASGAPAKRRRNHKLATALNLGKKPKDILRWNIRQRLNSVENILRYRRGMTTTGCDRVAMRVSQCRSWGNPS